jgi:hypothetical protein
MNPEVERSRKSRVILDMLLPSEPGAVILNTEASSLSNTSHNIHENTNSVMTSLKRPNKLCC